MDNQSLLREFFSAENRRDWAAYARFLHPDVTWTLYSQPVKIVRGAKAYLEAMQAAYAASSDTFVCETMQAGADGRRIVTLLCNNHGERSCDIFDLENGLIIAEYEFLLG